MEAGKTYTLNVTTYDGQKAEASCTIPLNRVDIKKAKTKDVIDVKFQSTKYLVTWEDIPQEKNYYAVYVLTKYVSITNKYVSVDQEDFENSIVASDQQIVFVEDFNKKHVADRRRKVQRTYQTKTAVKDEYF